MKCSDVILVCEKLVPLSYAEEWDNPGFQTGRHDKEVSKILLAVDLTDAVLDEAEARGADMIITHHPLIFKGLKLVNDSDFVGKRILRLASKDIAYYAMHTNFDCMPGGMGDSAGKMMDLQNMKVLEPTGAGPDGKEYGIGVVGNLPAPMTLREIAEYTKKVFRIPHVSVFGDLGSEKMIRRAAILPGSGGSDVDAAVASGAEVYISGDISHHQGLDGLEKGIPVIDAGHYGIEHIFMPVMKDYLEEILTDEVEIMTAEEHFPAEVI
ncbi:Nif3-like dinuclear metal center hexameric protein [[Clostridium] aminophilum]|uniref:GTP cyclohydrolase 1 type 2 homolog n=1 Tax=[Clostridium] aminophilum TaxID=1526 RepID=A0A1I6K2Y9_9FIRM|nr:Nif3-like dinuclear metal center hexameric protein [[Clostridium] aminophilum]SFR85602.1 dinuclear metal center protein, YbgI/SA1388 family [[Clostridium] aminophilum]